MRVHLARDPETRTVQVTIPVAPLPGRVRGGKGIFYVRPGERFGPYSHQELWDLRAFGNNETDAAALWHGLLTVPRQPTVGLPGIPRPARGPGDLRSGWVARSGDRATTRATTRVAHCFRTLLANYRGYLHADAFSGYDGLYLPE